MMLRNHRKMETMKSILFEYFEDAFNFSRFEIK